MSTIGIVGIIVALAIFLYGAYKNVSTLYLAPLCAVIVAITNGISATEAFTSLYIGAVEEGMMGFSVGGVVGMIITIFPTVFLGALFGKVLTDCGAATAIAKTLTDRFVINVEKRDKQIRRAVLVLLIIECILLYGGVDCFVAVFATFPIVMYVAEKVNIPRRFVPALLILNVGANGAPYVLSIGNIVCMNILGTSSGAAPIPGFITFIIVEVGIYFICVTFIKKAIAKGEQFELAPGQVVLGDAREKLPNFFIALIPLVVVFILFATIGNATIALIIGIILAIVLMGRNFNVEKTGAGSWFRQIFDTLNAGAASGASSLMVISAPAGFATIVQKTAVFAAFVGVVFSLPLPPMICCMVLMIVVVALTSSPPATLMVALPMIAGAYVATGILDPNAVARVAAMTVSTFETLPVNGLIILTTGLAQVPLKKAYLPMFLQSVIMTLIGALICAAMLAAFPGLA